MNKYWCKIEAMFPHVFPVDIRCRDRFIVDGTMFVCQKKQGHSGKHKAKGNVNHRDFCIKWERGMDEL